jgi:hypothetical protein
MTMSREAGPRVYVVEEQFDMGGVSVDCEWKCRLDGSDETWMVVFEVDGDRVSTDVEREEVPYGVREEVLHAVREDLLTLEKESAR